MNKSTPTAKPYNFDTKTLSYLVGIIDEKSLSKAAEKFYISQPALSRCLKNVETTLGIELFTHIHNKLEPTDAGKIFINGARSLLYIEQTALQKLKILPQRDNYLSIWTEEWFYPILTQSIQPDFQNDYPEIYLEVTVRSSQQIQEGLSNGSVDIGVFLGDKEESPFYSREVLFSSNLVLCTPSLHPASSFLLSTQGTYLRHMQDQVLREQSSQSQTIAGELSWELLNELLLLGYGNVILPERLVSDHISIDRLTPLASPRICHGILGQYQGLTLSEPVQFLRDLIIRVYSKELLP